jgi:cell division protein FtsL
MTPPVAAVAETMPRTRRSTRRAPVRHPRRISGPARPTAVAAVAIPAPAIAPRRSPSRPAGPARRRSRAAQRRPAPASRGLALRAIDAYERVCDSALLDRLVRGRLWIGLLAFALIGIVAMQLMVLKLNEGIGATLKREAALQRENAQLGIEAATVSGESRVEPLAAASGMTFAAPGSVHFVSSSRSDVSRAAAALAAPIQPHEATATSTGEGAEASTVERTEASSATSEAASSGVAGASASTSGEPAGEATPESGASGSSGAQSREASASEASASAPSESQASTAAPSALGGVEAGHEAGHG